MVGCLLLVRKQANKGDQDPSVDRSVLGLPNTFQQVLSCRITPGALPPPCILTSLRSDAVALIIWDLSHSFHLITCPMLLAIEILVSDI